MDCIDFKEELLQFSEGSFFDKILTKEGYFFLFDQRNH